MAINFIPNDPLSPQPPLRKIAPRPDRPAGSATFLYGEQPAEGLYQPGTPEFLFWQTREAALAAVETWESLHEPILQWPRAPADQTLLALEADAGEDLNARYDGIRLQFFHFKTGNKATWSGASCDVVCHEVGHACLDVLRPDLFNFPLPEIAAFHEAFGDCLSLITALHDGPTRKHLLAESPTLEGENFLETMPEDLADGVRRAHGAQHAGALPRRAFNNFQWLLPDTLPSTGGPSELTQNPHSFARIFTGCFYDALRFIFQALPAQNSANLLKATQIAGRLLIAGAKAAPAASRFFREVGRCMVLADQSHNGGAYRDLVSRAFQGHGIMLGANSALAPQFALSGSSPDFLADSARLMLPASVKRDLLDRLAAPRGVKLALAALRLGAELVVRVVYQKEVSLTGVAKALSGVVALAPVAATVGQSGEVAALLGSLPDVRSIAEETRAFVEMLLARGHIAEVSAPRIAKPKPRGRRRKVPPPCPTHVIRSRGKKKKLTRICFLCGCG